MVSDKWLNILQDKLPARRIAHCVNVAQEAVKLARHYHVDEAKAYEAGILHDYCKYDSDEEILRHLHTLYDAIDPSIALIPNIAHGEAAYVVLKNANLGLSEDVLLAIRYHTYGHVPMTMLEKVVYMADLIEASRTFEGVTRLRELAYVSMDEAMLLSIESTRKYVQNNGGLIHQNTNKLAQELLKRRSTSWE